MCKDMPVILFNRVVGPKRKMGKKWRAEEEERHEGSVTPPKQDFVRLFHNLQCIVV
jgi:hypothetical protein